MKIGEDRVTIDSLDAMRIVWDTDLLPGTCRIVGADGMAYVGPLAEIPKGMVYRDMNIATDLWQALNRQIQCAKLDRIAKEIGPVPGLNAPVRYTPLPRNLSPDQLQEMEAALQRLV